MAVASMDPVPVGVPDCADRECGDDGCGGVCGICAVGETCQSDGTCKEYTVTPGMVLVPAGSFWMGCNATVDTSCDSDEKPQHQVTLSAYEIDVTEVTVAGYKQCVTSGACSAPSSSSSCSSSEYGTYGALGKEQHPVNCVTWTQSSEYCSWKGKRLCTEAEWEKAARGGCETVVGDCKSGMRTYPWGDSDPTCDVCWFKGCPGDTQPVGLLVDGGSPYGVLDMAGNVWEWVADWYASDYYTTSPGTNPTGPASSSFRVFRGGSFVYDAVCVRGSYRFDFPPPFAIDYLGLRCCRTPTGG